MPPNPPSKDSIKNWLKKHHSGDREWLADACGVTPKTVNNWLSSRIAIPQKGLRVISQLMTADAEKARAARISPPQNLVLEVPPPVFDSYNRAANAHGQTIRAWAIDALSRSAARAQILRAAEDPAAYGLDDATVQQLRADAQRSGDLATGE